MMTHQEYQQGTLESNKVILRELTSHEIVKRLAQYERQYGMTSAEFYSLWETGRGLDTEDSTAWALLYQIFQQNGAMG